MKHWTQIVFILLAAALYSCNGTAKEIRQDWSVIADSTSRALVEHYWNAEEKRFNYENNGQNTDFHYWPQAHALDVMLDAYFRTGGRFYLTRIHDWFEGVPKQNGGDFLNRYIDDMEWNVLAILRAFQLTGDKKFMDAAEVVWEDIKAHWSDVAGGGLMWEKQNPSEKNACSNGPAAIFAARLFREKKNFDDLEWAKKIYHWERSTLFDEESGAIWDNIKETGEETRINKRWVFTYNQGTFIGAAIELFDLTSDSVYFQDAIRATDYTLHSLTDQSGGILKNEGDGDGGLFKGIFIRYFTRLIRHHALSGEKKQAILR